MKITMTQTGSGCLDAKIAAERIHVVLVAAHTPFRDPRIAWEVDCAPASDAFVCIGLHSDPAAPKLAMNLTRPNAIEVKAYRNSHLSRNIEGNPAWYSSHLLRPVVDLFVHGATCTVEELTAVYGIEKERAVYFQPLCDYFSQSAKILVDIGLGLERISSVIAADLDSLLPALVLKTYFGVPVFYDAHETWPDSFPDFSAAEVTFWSEFEKLAVKAG